MQPAQLRALVLDLFSRIHDGRELADRALDRALRANPSLHSRERRLVSEATFAMVRHVRRLDWQLSVALAATRQPSFESFATPEQHRLRFALALATELDRTPQEAASLAGCDASLARTLDHAATTEPRWPENPVQNLAVRRSVPDWIAARLIGRFGDEADALLAALNDRAPLSLRANLLKNSREQLIETLKKGGIEARPGRWSPWAVTLEGRPNIFALPGFKEGLFEVQDEGSQLIALITGAASGKTVVDACAGGGGKTLALGAMMKNKGRLVACDVTPERMRDLAPRARRGSVFCIEPKVVSAGPEGDDALKNLTRKADVVLIDAPCSGTGSWRRNPDARWRMTEEEAAKFPALQLSILERYSRLVKPGGALVYATCSVLKEENEDVVAAFTADERFTLEAAPVSRELCDDLGRLRLLPHTHGTDGFFAAVLRKA